MKSKKVQPNNNTNKNKLFLFNAIYNYNFKYVWHIQCTKLLNIVSDIFHFNIFVFIFGHLK